MIRIITILTLVISSEGIHQPRLVYPRLLEERSADGRMVLHLHDQLTLNLRKASVAARDFRVLEHEDGKEVMHFLDGRDLEENLHEDEKHYATVEVTRRDSGVEVEGLVGPNHRIEPMPTMERSDEGLIPHMIHEIEKQEMVDIQKAIPHKDSWTVDERSNSAQTPPANVTVEIFIVSDQDHFGHFNSTRALIVYICIQLNSVNMRYKDTSAPLVQFLLMGVEKDKFSTYKRGAGKLMESSSSLAEFQKYAYGKRYDFGHPDLVFLMSGFEVYSEETDGTKSMNVLGIGYVGGLCTSFYVALGEDKAGHHTGMHTLTHETGHVLGSSHDGEDPALSIPGHPGSLNCPWDDGHIMSYVDGGVKHHHFSKCSLEQIRHLVTLRGQVCWDMSKTNDGHKVDNIYPGMEVAPNHYCKTVFPDEKNVTADMHSPRMAECMVKCQYPKQRQVCNNYGRCSTYVSTYYLYKPALDYMHCTAEKVCIQGECGKSKLVASTQRPGTSATPETTTPTAAGTKCQCDCTTAASRTTGYPPRPTTRRMPNRWFSGWRRGRK